MRPEGRPGRLEGPGAMTSSTDRPPVAWPTPSSIRGNEARATDTTRAEAFLAKLDQPLTTDLNQPYHRRLAS